MTCFRTDGMKSGMLLCTYLLHNCMKFTIYILRENDKGATNVYTGAKRQNR